MNGNGHEFEPADIDFTLGPVRARAQMGGFAVRTKEPPDTCPRCGESMAGRTWHSYLGHLGLHGLADAYFGGDMKAAQRRLMENGWAAQDSDIIRHFYYRPIQEGK